MSDDNPYRNQDFPPYPPRRVDGAGVALGFVTGIVVAVLDVALPGPPAILLGVVMVGVAVWLMLPGRSPFARGFGVGLLVAVAIAALLVGTCLAIVASSID